VPGKIYQVLGRNIREQRLARDWPLQHLAKLLGVSYQQVQKYEKGANRLPSHMLVALADEFGCSTDDLCGRSVRPLDPALGLLLQRLNGLPSNEARDRIFELIEAAIEIAEGSKTAANGT
jgi:transcriptional regulator with XRE-family HTH domain